MKAMRLKTLSAAALAALALVGATAQAQLIRAQDDDIEFVLTSTLQPKTSGLLVEGDIIVSVFEFPELHDRRGGRDPGGPGNHGSGGDSD